VRDDEDDDERVFRKLQRAASPPPATAKPSTKAEPSAKARRRKWKARSLTFSLPNGQLAARGASRKAKYRVLRELEAAGLITVERQPRKSPRVTLSML
jgi:hypothetical protein